MARKPTKFWHPARRLLLDLQEKSRTFMTRPVVTAKLEDVRPRLQHYLRAMYGESVSIESLGAPAKPGLAKRVLRAVALIRERGFSESDASCIRLPPLLPIQPTSIPPLDQYRLLAVQHAERIRRHSASHEREVTGALERDLYQLAEAATIDAEIVASQPGLRVALETARRESMEQRPRPRWRTDIELHVEKLTRNAWSLPDAPKYVADEQLRVPRENSAEENATWARRTAVALESKFGRKAAKAYRRVPENMLWQTTVTTRLPEQQQFALETQLHVREPDEVEQKMSAPSRSMMPGGAQSTASQKKQSAAAGKSEGDKGSSRKKSSDAQSPQQPDDEGESKSSNNSEKSESAKPAKEVSNDPHSGDEGSGATAAHSADGETRTAVQHVDQKVDDASLTGAAFRYPEWDCNKRAFNTLGTVVRVMPPPVGDSEWARLALQNHAREVQLAKRQFERLRSNRVRLRRQMQGDEIDLEACVEAMVDRMMRLAPTDRLYSLVRPGRRELAITLLIDVSGSTGDAVAGTERVIDIERITAVVATAAFDALGDDYSILAFSSASATNVRVHTIKSFGEKNSTVVLQRIGALAPHGTTRLGAAVRHATSLLAGHAAPHRLLLIISDGKPYDYDWYWTDFAIQDSRQAVLSARLRGIHPFCITVDTVDDESYLPEIFGSAGYRVVSRPSQLSHALLLAVERMIGSSG